ACLPKGIDGDPNKNRRFIAFSVERNSGMSFRHKVRRRKGGAYPLSHLYGHFGLDHLAGVRSACNLAWNDVVIPPVWPLSAAAGVIHEGSDRRLARPPRRACRGAEP